MNRSAPNRPFLIAGNWKLNHKIADAIALVREVGAGLAVPPPAQVVVAPVFTALWAVQDLLEGKGIALAGQDVYWEDGGAFTGEVSAPMLADAGCTYCIVGHSERRHLFGETDAEVRKKVHALLAHDLTPIVCVGETLEQREAGETESVVLGQLNAAIEGVNKLDRLVIAYEPVWAIGTGRTAAPEDAQAVHAVIRARLAEVGGEAADRIRILYGGSVKPANASALLGQTDIDGALVGGASLKAGSFLAIIDAANNPG